MMNHSDGEDRARGHHNVIVRIMKLTELLYAIRARVNHLHQI